VPAAVVEAPDPATPPLVFEEVDEVAPPTPVAPPGVVVPRVPPVPSTALSLPTSFCLSSVASVHAEAARTSELAAIIRVAVPNRFCAMRTYTA
jgi:hypothetical protein